VLSHWTVTVKALWSSLVVLQLNLENTTFAWYVPPMHMHRRRIMSDSVVTEIKYKLTCSKIGSRIAFWLHMKTKKVIWQSILPVTHAQSPFHHLNLISISWLVRGDTAGVKAYGFNRLWFLNQWQIRLGIGGKWRYALIWLRSPRTYHPMTTSWSRSSLRH